MEGFVTMADIEHLINEYYNKPQHSFGLSCKVCDGGVCIFYFGNTSVRLYQYDCTRRKTGCPLHPDGSCAESRNAPLIYTESDKPFIDKPSTPDRRLPFRAVDDTDLPYDDSLLLERIIATEKETLPSYKNELLEILENINNNKDAKPKNSSASQMGFIDPETGEIVWPDKGTDELAQSPLHEDASYLCSLCNKFHDPEYLCYGINYCIRCGSISHKSEDCPKF